MNHSLRGRLKAATLGMTALNALLFSAGVFVVFDVLEDGLFDRHLARDREAMMRLYQQHGDEVRLQHEEMRVHVARGGDRSTLPAFLATLPDDEDEVHIDGVEYDLDTERLGADTFYFLFDDAAVATYEQQVAWSLALVMALLFGVAAAMNLLFTRRVIRPITELAQRIAKLEPGSEQRLPVDDEGPRDELWQLARAVNAYNDEIRALLTREREFSSDVAHELRTPLMGIQGAAENLERTAGIDTESLALTGRMRRCSTQMSTLIDALLTLARDASRLERLREPVNVEEVLAEQLQLLRELTERKGILVNVHREPSPAVSGIPAVLRVVLGNLLRNAVGYTNQKVIDVFVSPAGVVIQDYGPGLGAAEQASMFERLQRIGQRDDEGVGIGLALVRRLCQQLEWGIEVNSAKGTGTRIALQF